jgi:protein-export membrane protein SecD
MLNFSRLKIISISVASMFALLLATSSIFTDSFLQKIFWNQKLNLGLDLRGGSQLVLEIDFDYYLKEQLENLKDEIKTSFIEDSVRAIPDISQKKITFYLDDEEQKKSARKIIKKTSSKVDFVEQNGRFEIYFSQKEERLMRKNLTKQSIEIVRRRIDEAGTKEPTIQSDGDNRILLQVPGVKNSDELKQILGKTAKMTFHLVNESGSERDSALVYDEQGKSISIKKEVALSGDLLVDANTTYHQGEPAVAFRFNSAGTQKFAKITSENAGKFFAILLDGKVITAPRINGAITQGSGVISGNFTTASANQLSVLLRAGALPAPLLVIEERSVGPSLGLDSIKSGTFATIAGFGFIAFFMLLFYGFFGVIANFAMAINLAIILSTLSIIGATLTLPGIAGIALTMGMSVDANVLIFERIKEELREKKSVFVSIEQGFTQAFRTITDSNITTLIVAIFLYIFGNGPVKGFAVTLSIGIASSMFSAIVLTRMLIAIWVKKRRPQKLKII